MRNFKKILALCLTLALVLSLVPAAFAATVGNATIDTERTASLTMFKYDFTAASKDGVWTANSFASTGVKEEYVEKTLGGAIRQGDKDSVSDLGNGQTSNGYAIKGVEFSVLKVADIVQFTESSNDGHAAYNKTVVLYGINKVNGAGLLKAIGLDGGANRYANADNTDKLDSAANYYYESDVLISALASALTTNATTVKNALETYMASANGVIVMDETDADGMTTKDELPLGLYLVVETKVPEMVTSTVNPFFVSLPMTTVTGGTDGKGANSASPEGGHEWNYDIVVYPKNETGIPTLEKTVREAKNDTGKHEGSDVITDGFAHNATGSAGDVMEYQIISTLPTITSKATALSVYKFFDTLSEGLTYAKKDVVLEFFKDKACTESVAKWTESDGKFTVAYSGDDRTMTIDMTEKGLAEINGDAANANGILYAGYSNYTLRITYTATINSDNTFVYGDSANENTVVLTWKRSNSNYLDTLIDDCHVYSYGIDLTKEFSDKGGAAAEAAKLFEHVKFKLYNATDKYWVVATLNEEEGIYYVTDHVEKEDEATAFVPVVSGEDFGKVIIKGLEDDEYVLTECETANGYTLLKEAIEIVISTEDNEEDPCDVYTKDVLGVLQNDPRYAIDGGLDLHLANIPQKQLAHNFFTASATVDGNDVEMKEDNGSLNAEAQLTVVNTKGFDLPQSGDWGVWLYVVPGILAMATAITVIFFATRKRETEEQR